MLWNQAIAGLVIALFLAPALAQFSDPTPKISKKGLHYREVIVTARARFESCFFLSCQTREIPIRGLLWLPAKETPPYKVVVFSHGAQGPTPTYPTGVEPDVTGLPGEFHSKGYAVLMAYRKGRSVNDLPKSEVSADDVESNQCRDDMRPGIKSAAADLKAYLDILSSRPDLDAKQILLMGHSRGGATSLAVASGGYPGVVGVINISGGWITPYAVWGNPGAPCNPSFNPTIFKEFGESVRVPVLSLYGSNDPLFDVAHIRTNLSFLGKHAESDFLIVDGADHRAILGAARPNWEEKQTRFLRLMGLQ